MKNLIYLFILFLPLSTPARDIIAMGDLHGDLQGTLEVLEKASVIDENQNWIGGDSIVVQTGDQIDRGAYDKEIIDLFEKLAKQAPLQGGEVHSLIGNHEAMNVYGNFKYVFPDEAFFSFEHYHSSAPDNYVLRYPSYQRGRAHAFYPGGEYAEILSQRKAILKIGPYVFVHGGIVPQYAKKGISQMNKEIAQWMSKLGPRPKWVKDSDGPLWSRHFSDDTGKSECKMLKKSLKILKAKIMFVGHTVQDEGINTSCDGQVVRLDTGISAYYEGLRQAVLIRDGELYLIQ